MDSSGLQEHKPIRQSMYKTADVIIFCYSLSKLKIAMQRAQSGKVTASELAMTGATSSHFSLNNIRSVWLPEVLDVIKCVDPVKEKQKEKEEQEK